MRFSVKIFLATMVTMILSFSLGGYILISSMFHNTLERELKAAVNENKMLRFSIETAAFAASEQGSLSASMMRTLVQRITETTTGREEAVRATGADFELIFESKAIPFDTEFIRKLRPDKRAYRVVKSDEKYFVQTACIILPNTPNWMYLESFYDITGLFENRHAQFATYQKIIIVMMVVNGVLTYLISQWLIAPIRSLSRMTRRIADGGFDKRVLISSKDEIGMLASDFNNMAAEIENKISELEDAARRQEDFVASFAHELKTPLTSIIGYSDMLRSKEMTEEDRFLASQYIFNEGKRLESLSLKLLDLIVLGKKDFEKKKVSAKWLLEDAIGFLSPSAVECKIKLEISAENAALSVEPDLMKTLLINLLDNARKAVDQEGKIALIGRCEDDGYAIYISDNGRGIPSEELPKITEAFYMVDKSRSRSTGGAGLGLAICSEIAALHDAQIEFKSMQEKGTMVRVYIKERL